MIELTNEAIKKIESSYGSPFYLLDEAGFIDNYEQFVSTMKRYYSKYALSYSYKTNYTPYVCSLVKSMGGYAEVVSEMEYYIATRIGYDDPEIIVNGPDKGEFGLTAIQRGCIVNVDSIDELKRVVSYAQQNSEQRFDIGLRVNLDVGQSFVSRFGLDTEDLDKAFSIVAGIGNLHIVGLHCHISRCRGVNAWRKRTEHMLSLVDRYFPNEPPKYIDLGSGMYGQMDPEFAQQFTDVPSYEDYAIETAKLVAEHFDHLPEAKRPVLFTEPGTTLINKYIDFVGKVDVIKSIGSKQFAILNCSEHNLGETCMLKQLPMRVIAEQSRQAFVSDCDIVGYTCLEQDFMYRDYSGPLAVGDRVQFGNVGGYSNVYKPPFIRPNCPMLAQKSNGQIVLIKRKEQFDDLLGTYVFS